MAGNREALGAITKTAETLLTAARSFYGPTAAYGNLFNVVTAQLQTLTMLQPAQLQALQSGGLVTNGVYGMDSVRFGNTMVAGGEFITQASAVNSATLPILQAINSGRAPSNDNMMQAIRSGFMMLARIIAEGNERTSHVGQQIAGLRTDVRQKTGEQSLRAAG
jgi:hypothetical protein